MSKFLIILLCSFSFAQTISDNVYTHAEVSALAGAVVAEKGHIWNIIHNPAGITEVDGLHVAIGGGRLYGYDWLPASNLSCTAPVSEIGTIGFAFQQLQTKYSGKTLSVEQTLSIAHGFDLQQDNNSHLAVGYTTNFVNWNLGKSAGVSGDGSDGLALGSLNSITIDFGVLASLREKYRFGVLMKNINSGSIGKGITRQVLPRKINAGISYMPTIGLVTSIVSEYLLGRDDLQIKGSIKFTLNPYIIICAGAQSNPNRFGLGATFTSISKSISYGLLTHPVLPITHQVTIGIIL